VTRMRGLLLDVGVEERRVGFSLGWLGSREINGRRGLDTEGYGRNG
jgi:hypothetical protein